jgi:hypothetical protein
LLCLFSPHPHHDAGFTVGYGRVTGYPKVIPG